jgi:hypothetical protein
MRRLLTLAVSTTLFTVLAFADNWTGRLIDANCTNQDKTAKDCDAGSSTTAFLLAVADGKVYKLDDVGNRKALDAIKNRSDRSANPASPTATQVIAKISGDKDGDMLKVTTIEVQ